MNDKLKGISIEEMQNEIKRRLNNKPQLLKDPRWNEVVNMVERDIINHPIKDYEHYLFETVMEAMYGVDFWDWWKNKMSSAEQSDQ